MGGVKRHEAFERVDGLRFGKVMGQQRAARMKQSLDDVEGGLAVKQKEKQSLYALWSELKVCRSQSSTSKFYVMMKSRAVVMRLIHHG